MNKIIKNNIVRITILLVMSILLSPSNVFAATPYSDLDMNSAEYIITLLVNLVLTILAYCTVPTILRLKNGKYEYKKGHKIVLINCGVVWLICTMITIGQGYEARSWAVFLYYAVNRAILLKPKEDEEEIKKEDNKKENFSLSFANETEIRDRSNSFNVYGEDIKLEKTVEQIEEKQLDNLIEKLQQEKKENAEPVKTVEKVVERKDDKTLLYVIIGILAAAVIGIGIYAFSLADTYEGTIDDLEYEINKLENDKAGLNASMILYESYEEKADFLDERIVFVIDGYGDYYYTYDQMNTVTQGIGEYTFWAYNVEQAISRGYRAWKQ